MMASSYLRDQVRRIEYCRGAPSQRKPKPNSGASEYARPSREEELAASALGHLGRGNSPRETERAEGIQTLRMAIPDDGLKRHKIVV